MPKYTRGHPDNIQTYFCDYCAKPFRRYASEQGKNKSERYCSRDCLIKRRADPDYWFWPKVRKQEDGCWIWTGAVYSNGYGTVFGVGPPPRKKKRRTQAHRFAYQLLVGEIPSELLVLHKCDVRLCVNPEHLFLGTHKDNTQDCIRKGRFRYGAKTLAAAS